MKDIHIFNTIDQQAYALANSFRNLIISYLLHKNRVNIAVSGGSTPAYFFSALATNYKHLPWDRINIYWVDERCVPPEDEQSNFGMTQKYLLTKINIPQNNIFRIHGEATPEEEIGRYSKVVTTGNEMEKGWPVFDWILLGLGEDGHTASLFPGTKVLKSVNSITDIAIHPDSGQKRITLTLPVLNNAKKATFLVSGSSKSNIVQRILKQTGLFRDLPAAMVKSEITEWYLDEDAAAELD